MNIPSELMHRLQAEGPWLVLTGAGISAESGLSTFRGPGGLWEGRPATELATPEAFAADPEEVWRFYTWRRARAAEAWPNRAHEALAELQQRREATTLVTQNVDGLHERAGSTAVTRLHGSLWRLRCSAEGTEQEDLREELPALPRCSCGALLRPGVVWFGESLPAEALAHADRASREARLVLVIGTSSMVYPAAALPVLARQHGAFVVEINPERTPLTDHADLHLAGPAGEWVPRLVEAVP